MKIPLDYTSLVDFIRFNQHDTENQLHHFRFNGVWYL